MAEVEQELPSAKKWNFSKEIPEQLARSGLLQKIRPGARIAVGVGSRGISNVREIVSATIAALKAAKADVFVIPAMGSHGGGTSEGQTHVLAEYGITPESMGVPFDARMETRKVGTTSLGTDVYVGEAALAADGIILINRIKPHTDFTGNIGSGLMKMCVIGLGKHQGAILFHGAASRLGYEECIRATSRVIIEKAPVLGGLALVEDANHATASIEAVLAADFEARENVLFQEATRLMPKIPFAEVDLLIVDEMGKNISGAGMDTNVVGRTVHGYMSSLKSAEKNGHPHVHRIFVRGLTPESEGNAVGIGMADFTTTRCVNQISLKYTYTNSLTALTPIMAKIPIYFDTDRECIERALTSLALPDASQARVVRITNTLSLKRLQASSGFGEELKQPQLKTAGKFAEMGFDGSGNLLSL
jgi:hypothetical protein